MPYILIYEPKEGLKYYLQKYKGDWRLNGLRNNAFKFDNWKDATDMKERFRFLSPEIQISQISVSQVPLTH